MASATTAATITLPPTGKARVKNVLSGDTLVLLGSAPGGPNVTPPEVLFTLDGILAPRYVFLCNAITFGFSSNAFLLLLIWGVWNQQLLYDDTLTRSHCCPFAVSMFCVFARLTP
jgi:hypothetical protein